MKRDTYMRGPTRPYHPQSPLVEAAKFLRDAASRYARGRANVGDVEVAITEWNAALAENKGWRRVDGRRLR